MPWSGHAGTWAIPQLYEEIRRHRTTLVFTNTRKVWRDNTRGDYWVLDRRTGQLKQIGAFAKPSTLMYAKFSPDGGRVGYVVENNLYAYSTPNSGEFACEKLSDRGPGYGIWAATVALAALALLL